MPRAEAQRIPASRTMQPFQQGEFDGFCGLYALINAFRLTVGTTGCALDAARCLALFRHGVAYLQHRERLSSAVRYGLRANLWHHLATELAREVSSMTGKDVCIGRPLARQQAVSLSQIIQIVRTSVAEELPVLALLKGAYDHYTVIVGSTPKRLILFDSYGYQWVATATCGSTLGGVGSKHQIKADYLLTVRA